MYKKSLTRQITVAHVKIGGGADICIQSMTNTRTSDVNATVSQIRELETAGCEIVRVAVPSAKDAEAISEIRKQIRIPLVADIHFDHKLALRSIEAGADKIRINPGNIGNIHKTASVLDACEQRGIPIRIGVNAGSLEKDILKKYGHPTAEAMVESAERHLEICEKHHFRDVVVSLKASSVPVMIRANEIFSQRYDYPLHLGVTEAGTAGSGSIRSAVGLGILLSGGIGDTIRVSLAGEPVREISAALTILQALELRKGGVKVIACPTCGRTSYDVAGVASDLEKRLAHVQSSITIAVMGCIVNGPGEAREADIGIAGAGNGKVMMFEKGVKREIYPIEGIADRILKRIGKK